MKDSLRHFVIERSGYACEYCLVPEEFDPSAFQIDHIIASKHEGKTVENNLAYSCLTCNLHKGPNIAGLVDGEATPVRLFHPRNDSWPDHFAFNDGFLAGKTAVGMATVKVLCLNLPMRVRLRLELTKEGVLQYPS